MDDLRQKWERLRARLAGPGSLNVAYSGGVDSALLLRVAHEVLGSRVLAVTADSPSVPRRARIRYIANGTNVDDLGDYRPGLQAAAEYRVVSPLKEAGFTKADVRALARRLDLQIWDKPASPFLASRIPYGQAVTPEKLHAVENAEEYLRRLGIRELRVRRFGKKARIETGQAGFAIIQRNYAALLAKFTAPGFEDIEVVEFKSGALNALLKIERR